MNCYNDYGDDDDITFLPSLSLFMQASSQDFSVPPFNSTGLMTL